MEAGRYVITGEFINPATTTDTGLYMVLDYPHQFSSISPISYNVSEISGNIDAVNSITTIASVEWSLDIDATSWNACVPLDGTFDSLNEDFNCDIPDFAEGTSTTVYIRSCDQYGSCTYKSKMASTNVIIDHEPPTANIISQVSDGQITVSLVSTDEISPIQSVEFQLNGTSGAWIPCTVVDGGFDEISEDVICELPTSAAGATLYLRVVDGAGNIAYVSNASILTVTGSNLIPVLVFVFILLYFLSKKYFVVIRKMS